MCAPLNHRTKAATTLLREQPAEAKTFGLCPRFVINVSCSSPKSVTHISYPGTSVGSKRVTHSLLDSISFSVHFSTPPTFPPNSFCLSPLLKGRRDNSRRGLPQPVPPRAQRRRAVQQEEPRAHAAGIQDHAGASFLTARPHLVPHLVVV